MPSTFYPTQCVRIVSPFGPDGGNVGRVLDEPKNGYVLVDIGGGTRVMSPLGWVQPIAVDAGQVFEDAELKALRESPMLVAHSPGARAALVADKLRDLERVPVRAIMLDAEPPTDRERVCQQLLKTLDEKNLDPETAGRMARALGDLTSGYAVTDFESMLKTFPIAADPGVVVVRDVPFASLCEHHVLPFTGTASVAYLPDRRIVGLSKIPRLVRAVSRRLQVQERIGHQVADAMMKHIEPKGVLVVLRGRHSCMALRGAESPGEMVTSAARGVFLDDAAARAEALELMK